MANFTNSVLPAALVQAQMRFKELEARQPEYGGFRSFIQNSDLFPMIPRLASERQRPSSFTLPIYNPATAGSALTCNPTAASGDTVDTALVWNEVTGVMNISKKRQTENRLTTMEQAAIDAQDMWGGIYEKLETLALLYLETNRSQNDISVAGLSTYRGAANFDNTIPLLNQDSFKTWTKSEMRKAKYTKGLNYVYSAPYDEIFSHTQIQGAGNSENFADQKFLSSNFYTNSDIAMASTKGGVYVVPIGGIAAIFWIDEMYRVGDNSGNEIWDTVKDPLFGLDFSMFRTSGCADSTAINGAKQDNVEGIQVGINVAFTTAPVTSPANETVIHKYGVLTS